MVWLIFIAISWGWPLKGNSTTLPEEIDVSLWFQPSPSGWAGAAVDVDPLDLASAAAQTLNYLQNHPNDMRGTQVGMMMDLGIELKDIKETLAIIAFTGLYYPELLRSPNWWEHWFHHYSWKADAVVRNPQHADQLRFTRYVIYSVDGSTQKTEHHTQALWQTPKEELDLSETEAKRNCPSLLRCQISRQDVLNGLFEEEQNGAAEALIWVSEHHFHEAQLQGTIVVKDENGTERWFNVHRSNNKAYIKGKKPSQQERYWFFKETDGAYGWGSGVDKIPLYPGVSMAGDVDNLGLGKVIWIQSANKSSIGILSDTGGAFQPNLQQLDWFMGIYSSREALNAGTAMLPSYAAAGIVIRKRETQH